MNYWLVKTEPGCFSIEDLSSSPNKTTMWDGVRNYQARNILKDKMQIGDPVLFYHSITKPGVVGVAEVCSESYPDPTQWDLEGEHFDPASREDNPRWYVVDIRLVRKFRESIPLGVLRNIEGLEGMELLKKGSRLSVQPVRQREFEIILGIASNQKS